MKRLRTLYLAMALAALGIPAATSAQEAPRPTLDLGNLYLGVGVGPIVPQDMSAQLSGAISGSGKLSFNASGFLEGVAGYHVNEHIALEADIGWTLYDPFQLSGSFSKGGTALPSTFLLNGDFNNIVALANVLYRPLGGGTGWAPYLGGGIGLADLDWSLTTRPGAAVPLGVSGHAVDLALDAEAGLDYAITDAFSVGGRYRFLWINSGGGSLAGGGVVLVHGDALAHSFLATGTYRF